MIEPLNDSARASIYPDGEPVMPTAAHLPPVFSRRTYLEDAAEPAPLRTGLKSTHTISGGAASLLAGTAFAFSGVLFFAFLAGRFDDTSILSTSAFLAASPAAGLVWVAANWSAALGALLAAGGVLALEERLHPVHPGLARWTAALGLFGYALLALTSVTDLYQVRRLASLFPLLEPPAQAALEAAGPWTLDPAGNLRMLLFGTWFLAAGWLGLSGARLPRIPALLGILAGGLLLVAAGATLFEWPAVSSLALAGVRVFQPLWLLWTGFVLLGEKRVMPAG